MLLKPVQQKRKGSVLVEYGLLIAGIVLVSVVAIAVLGHKVSDQFGMMAVIMPGAHVADNLPIASGTDIPFVDDGTGRIVIDSANLVSKAGTDRTKNIIGPKTGETLLVD
jgi:Flp pilus assembly pilin Flp